MMGRLVLMFFLTIATFLILFPVLLVLKIYQEIIRLILKIKFGKNFGGLLSGGDKVWSIEETCRCIVNSFLILESDEDVYIFNESIKTHWKKIFQDKIDPKILSVRSTFLGHTVLIQNQLNAEDLIKVVKVDGILDRSYFRNCLDEYSNKALPKNDSALLEVILFDQPIKWSSESQRNQYVMVIRMHHSLGDGYALTKFLMEYLVDGGIKENDFILLPERKNLSNWLSNLYCALKGPSAVIDELIFKSPDDNILHGKKLCGEKLTACTVEKEERLVPMIKIIKNKTSIRFSDVILTAISASFRNFFIKKSAQVPEFITTVLPIMLNSGQNITLTNKLTMLMLDLPIRSNGDLMETLRRVSEQTKLLRNSPNALINYWVLAFITPLVPDCFLKYLKTDRSTLVVSCLPGPKKVKIQNRALRDAAVFLAQRDSTGVGLVVFSYDNRLQVAFNVDKELISKSEEAQDIADDVFKYIEELYQKLESSGIVRKNIKNE